MRKLLVIFCMAAMIAACGESSKNRTSGAESDENVEQDSVATPMEDSASMMGVDTTSAPDSIQ